jgi:polysaccharide pyruvyl transferase WcaK-like protein
VKISDFFATTPLEKTLLIGYYGGGNYGDELLMEVLSNLFNNRGIRDVGIMYQTPHTFSQFHHDFGYTILPSSNKPGMLKAIISNKNIVIGGGGLWGLDVNFNIFVLSFLLFVSRWVFGKKVYLLGVGYYNSTSTLGRISAFLAGKAANLIFARDEETLNNFKKLNQNVHLDTDIAWYLQDVNTNAYTDEVTTLEANIPVHPTAKTIFGLKKKTDMLI